jgi:hypothetical protein
MAATVVTVTVNIRGPDSVMNVIGEKWGVSRTPEFRHSKYWLRLAKFVMMMFVRGKLSLDKVWC